MLRKIGYIYDQILLNECNRLPVVLNRASIVHDLITSYGLLHEDAISVIASRPATEDELKYFHSSSYIDFLKKYNKETDLEGTDFDEEEQEQFGLLYDCPLLLRSYDFVQVIAGGSLKAANLLATGECNITINWFGGWHHAQRDEAEGFCYVNDVVIAIQEMIHTFPRILYIDFDIHHGNGVQNAFELSKKVLTLSFHKYSPGFYPGSGDINDCGLLHGKYYSLNVPLLEGCSNRTYLQIFKAVFPRVFQTFHPSAIVVQCGADGINGDPVGQTNLTPTGMGQCIKEILNCNLPTLFLGGGGYNIPNTARYWTYLTSLILDTTLDNDIPDCCEYFTKFEPTYELHIDEGKQKDCNTQDYINKIIFAVLQHCNVIESNCN